MFFVFCFKIHNPVSILCTSLSAVQYFDLLIEKGSITELPTTDMPMKTVYRCSIDEEVVRYNGHQFTSGEFKHFLRNNGIKQTLVPVYHHTSNRAAERSVQRVKAALLTQVPGEGSQQFYIATQAGKFPAYVQEHTSWSGRAVFKVSHEDQVQPA